MAKLSSVSTMSAASLDTSVPVMPMATPISAVFSAGASFTPSPVIATVVPVALQRLDDPQLVLGVDARIDRDLAHRRGRARSSGIVSSSAPGDRPAVRRDAELAGDDRRRLRMIAGDHDRPDAGASGRARPPPAPPRAAGRSCRSGRERRGPAPARSSTVVGRASVASGSDAVGDPERAQRLAGELSLARRISRAALRRERAVSVRRPVRARSARAARPVRPW